MPSPAAAGAKADPFRRPDKRACGFLYLRSLRTGTRALSLERGSLLDIIFGLHKLQAGGLWERMLREVRTVGATLGQDAALVAVLTGIEERIRSFIPLPEGPEASALQVTDLTRQDLRKTAAYFLRTSPQSVSVPFQLSGSGTLNILVLALLTFIADLKEESVIFAMEEPETAIPPYTQRRIVSALRSKATQCLFTSHSPYVSEHFIPDQLLVLRRGDDHLLVATPLNSGTEVKRKILQRQFRTRFAEGLLSRAVLIVEGESEQAAFPTVSDLLAAAPPHPDHLDILGVTTISAGGDGGIEQLGLFFGALGIRTYTFFDKQNDAAAATRIRSACHHAVESPHKGLEKLLAIELPVGRLRDFLAQARTWRNFPKHVVDPGPTATETEQRKYACSVLAERKGEGYAAELLQLCQPSELPQVMVDLLAKIQEDLAPPPTASPTPVSM